MTQATAPNVRLTRQTSVETLLRITAQGLLSDMRLRVYTALFRDGPMTSRELDNLLGQGEDRPSYHKRLSELERCGVAKVVGERPCSVSGRLACIWDVTNTLPVDAAEDLDDKIARLRAQQAALDRRINTLLAKRLSQVRGAP